MHPQDTAPQGVTYLPIYGRDGVRALALIDQADWPLVGGAFKICGVEALWPKALRKQLLQAGPLSAAQVRDLHGHIAAAFPPA